MIASGALSGPKPLAYRVMFWQTKVNKKTRPMIVSDKENENCNCQNVQNFSYWNRYFVIYPHKCTLNNLKKNCQEKWENAAYLTVKNAKSFQGPKVGPGPQPILAYIACLTPLRCVSKISEKISGPPWPNPRSAGE